VTGKPVAVVTGAARGIGAATALEFARRGYNVGVTDVLEAELAATAAQATAAGARVFTRHGDLADLAFAERFIAAASAQFARLDVLINNAAWRELLTMREISVESWDRTLRICLTAPAFLARWAASQMERQRRGVIINVSSIMARQSWGMAPAYVAAKGGLDALTRDLAALYGASGVRVVGISPGAVETDLSIPATSGADLRDWSEQMIPLRRWGTPAEIARAIVFLAGDDAAYITGTSLVIDGGWSHQSYPYGLKHALRPEQFP
jgi:3-oxoacyl-[acyl-carrier protein] reductase